MSFVKDKGDQPEKTKYTLRIKEVNEKGETLSFLEDPKENLTVDQLNEEIENALKKYEAEGYKQFGDFKQLEDGHTWELLFVKENSTETTTPTDTTTPVENQKNVKKNTVDTPKTGDNAMIYLYSFGIVIAAGATLILKNKKEQR